MFDVLGRYLMVGQRVGVAFSYSKASVGHLRLGEIREIDPVQHKFKIFWENKNVLSPWIDYGDKTRWIVL